MVVKVERVVPVALQQDGEEVNVNMKKYLRGEGANLEVLQDKKLRGQLADKEELYKRSARAAAKVEKEQTMVKADVVAYTPPPEFQEETKDSLVDIEFNDFTEFWLIELPENRGCSCLQYSHINGLLELVMILLYGGVLGDSIGKHYSMVSNSSKDSDTIVFVSSPSGPRIEPDELIAVNTDQKQMQKSTTMTAMTPTKSMRTPYSQTESRSNHTSRKSSVSDVGDERKARKRTLAEPSASKYSDLSDRSGLTNSGLSDQSRGKKSNWKADNEA